MGFIPFIIVVIIIVVIFTNRKKQMQDKNNDDNQTTQQNNSTNTNGNQPIFVNPLANQKAEAKPEIKTVKCEYCGEIMTASDRICPACGAKNKKLNM